MRNILVIFAVYAISLTAQADFRSEVFLGGSYGGQLSYKKTAVTYTMGNSGVPVGVFLGYKAKGGFYTGLEYTYIGLGFTDATAPTTHIDIPTTQHYAGVKFGYEGSRFRVFASYVPMNTMYFYRRATVHTNTPDVFYGTSAYGAGFGVSFGSRYGLDLSYFSDTFSTFDYGSSKGQSITGSSTFNNVTNTNIMLNFVIKLSGAK